MIDDEAFDCIMLIFIIARFLRLPLLKMICSLPEHRPHDAHAAITAVTDDFDSDAILPSRIINISTFHFALSFKALSDELAFGGYAFKSNK